MPEKDENLQLNYTDLKIVMETYQNVIQLNTILAEQQKQILELQKELVKGHVLLSDRQQKITEKIDSIIKDIEKETVAFHKELSLVTSDLHGRFNLSETNMLSRFDTSNIKVVEVKDKVTKMNLDIVKDLGSLKNKMYVAYVGFGLIILTLLGVVIAAIERFSLIGHINEMVSKIITFLKIH
jgi:hypothetical protein